LPNRAVCDALRGARLHCLERLKKMPEPGTGFGREYTRSDIFGMLVYEFVDSYGACDV